jgi:hypothetical protein
VAPAYTFEMSRLCLWGRRFCGSDLAFRCFPFVFNGLRQSSEAKQVIDYHLTVSLPVKKVTISKT